MSVARVAGWLEVMVMVAANGDGGGSPVRTVLIKAGCLGRRGSQRKA